LFIKHVFNKEKLKDLVILVIVLLFLVVVLPLLTLLLVIIPNYLLTFLIKI